jgi:hypothetical protein
MEWDAGSSTKIGNTRLYIKGTTGNVGIGTTSPSSKLTLAEYVSSTASPNYATQLNIHNSHDGGSRILFSNAVASELSAILGGVESSGSGTDDGILSFYTAVNSVMSEKVRITSAGRMGIGTTSPTSLLSVNGVASFGAGTAALPSISAFGDLDTGIWFPAENTFAVSTAGSERLKITSMGQVLINAAASRIFLGGATIPWLQIESVSSAQSRSQSIVNNHNSAAGPIFFMGKSRGTSTGSNTLVASGDNTGEIYFMGADGSDLILTASISSVVDGPPGTNDMPGRLVFSTTADGAATPTERMRINNAGKVLFGTSVARVLGTGVMPRLQLEGTDSHGASFSMIRNTATGGGPYFTLGKSRSGSLAGVDVVQSSDELGTLRFEGADGTGLIGAAEIVAAVDGTPGTNDMPGRLVFRTTADGDATPTERMRIDSAGNVGIGTTSPTAKLSVNGVIQGTSDFSADISSDTSAKFGTTDRAYMQINRVGTASGGYLGFYTSVTSVGTVAERMRIIESGNVGIGTATPDAALHIGGTGTLRIPGAVGGTGTPAIIDANGDIRPQISSLKFKHDIVDLDFDARTLAAFRAVRYVLNSDNSADFGFIAEELSDIFPLAVNFDKDGNPYSVKYGQITVLLTKGWQYHEQRLAEQSEINSKQAETIDSQARALASHEETIAEMKSSMAFFQKENEVLKKDALRSREVIDRLSRENDAMNERLAKLEAMVGKLV